MAFTPILQIRKPRLWGLNVKTCNNWASVWTQSQSLSESRACEHLWPLLTGACCYCLPVTTGQPSNWTSSKINCWMEKEILFVSKKTSCCIISASKLWMSTVKTCTVDLCYSKTSRQQRSQQVSPWENNQDGHGQWCVLVLVNTVWAMTGSQVPWETLGAIHLDPPCSLLPSSLSHSSFKSWIIFHLLQETLWLLWPYFMSL